MAHRYDTRTTIFSQEGRLYQVEYAMEAIRHAGMCIGILTKEGIVLAAEKKNTAKLLDTGSFPEKIFQIDQHIACAVGGISADANTLINRLRVQAQAYRADCQDMVPCEFLVRKVADHKQAYTQIGGLRPYGVSLLYMGWDKHNGFQLYQSDPSGNYSGWYATCIGGNQENALLTLKTDYKENCSMHEALLLVVKVLGKTMDSTTLTSEKLEFATLKLRDGVPTFEVWSPESISNLLKEGEAIRKKEEEEEKKKKEAAERSLDEK
eukprot:m.36387 g.36387  ORF g.36387 m.36387 type:complete len:265 (+) comp11412_c0_seq1:61-855(+)